MKPEHELKDADWTPINKAIGCLEELKEKGAGLCSVAELLRCVYGDRIADEHMARESIVLEIVRAKRRMGLSGRYMKAAFFKDIWPLVEKRLSEKDFHEIVGEVKRSYAKEQENGI